MRSAVGELVLESAFFLAGLVLTAAALLLSLRRRTSAGRWSASRC